MTFKQKWIYINDLLTKASDDLYQLEVVRLENSANGGMVLGIAIKDAKTEETNLFMLADNVIEADNE